MKNLIIRSLSGIAFIVIMVAAILAGPIWYALLFLVIIATTINEYLNLTIGRDKIVTKALAITSGAALFACSFLIEYASVSVYYLPLSAIPLFAIFIINLYNKEFNNHQFTDNIQQQTTPKSGRVNNGYEMFPFAITSVIYIALPMALCNLIMFDRQGNYTASMLLFILIVLWMNDVGAYCIGTAFGQNGGKKLFPSISPKKSWAGFFGGVACGAIVAMVMSRISIFEISMVNSAILAILICIFGVWGDLAESQLKRNFGVKDSGRIMPGHGGMLDRFDAALLAFPAAVFYLLLVN